MGWTLIFVMVIAFMGGKGQQSALSQKGSWIQKRRCPHDHPWPSLHLGEHGLGRMKVKSEAPGSSNGWDSGWLVMPRFHIVQKTNYLRGGRCTSGTLCVSAGCTCRPWPRVSPAHALLPQWECLVFEQNLCHHPVGRPGHLGGPHESCKEPFVRLRVGKLAAACVLLVGMLRDAVRPGSL